MKFAILCLVWLLLVSPLSAESGRRPKVDSELVTHHSVTIKGKRVKYSATVGTLPVWNEEGLAEATLFYTYYRRTNAGSSETRPLLISFNGGPGSASLWMHIAYTGPRILNIDDEGYPVQPYGVRENPYSVLDVADIVFVNPVETAYSRLLTKDADRKDYFGVNADVKYLAQWINTFVTRHNRWRSPKYLIGESYGTTRVSGLALELQDSQWMFLNGVILVSPTGLGIKRDGAVMAANRLPYFAAAAWYQNALAPELQKRELEDLLPEVEEYTLSELLPALSRGSSLSQRARSDVAEKMAYYSGLSKEAVLANNLDVPMSYFWKELMRERGYTLGRLDSRYLGIDRKSAGSKPDYYPELTAWMHAFTPAINYYLREHLNYKTDLQYKVFGDVYPWDFEKDKTGENLRQAMAKNPFMHVMVQAGYFDGATTYFNAKYTLWHLDPSSKMQDRMTFRGYRSGHMMYLRREDLAEANEDIREFLENSLPEPGEPARY